MDDGAAQVSGKPTTSDGSGYERLIHNVRTYIRDHHLASYAYVVFIISFFFVPHEKIYKLLFYLAVIPLFLISTDRDAIAVLKRSLVFRFAVLLLGYLSLTLAWTTDAALRDFDDVARGFVLLALFVAITIDLSWRDRLFTQRLFSWLVPTAVATAAISIVIHLFTHGIGQVRLVGLGVNDQSITSAYLYAIAALVTLYAMLNDIKSVPRKALLVGALAILIGYVALTASRGPMLAMGLAIVAGAAATRYWKLTLAIMLAGALLVTVGMVIGDGPYNVIARASNYRVEIWTIFLDRIAEHFWFGHGVVADTTALMPNGLVVSHAHQLFLGTHFYGGVPATALLLLMLGTAARVAWRRFRATGSFVYAALLIFVVMAGMTDFGQYFRSPHLIWIYFWLPVALIAGQEALDREGDTQAAAEGLTEHAGRPTSSTSSSAGRNGGQSPEY